MSGFRLTGKSGLDMALIGIFTLVGLAALGVFVYTNMLFERPLPSNKEEEAKLMQDSKKVVVVDSLKLEKIIINLRPNRSRMRYLDVTIHLIPFKSFQLEKLKRNKDMVTDIIIDVSSRMLPSEINTVSGKILLEDRIKGKINAKLFEPVVKEIYFSKFVVQ